MNNLPTEHRKRLYGLEKGFYANTRTKSTEQDREIF